MVDGLVVEDCAVRLVREREQNGDDLGQAVRDAVEIGARVLDREQVGANAEFVRAEFEKTSKEVQVEFADKARTIAEFFEKQFAEVFGESDGQLARELERRFGDGSSVSVQNRVKEAVSETLTRSREELVRQFAADDRNPLADFKSAAARSIDEAAKRSDATAARAAPEARRRGEGVPGAARREGEARRARRRARARHRQGPQLRGARSSPPGSTRWRWPRATWRRPWAT